MLEAFRRWPYWPRFLSSRQPWPLPVVPAAGKNGEADHPSPYTACGSLAIPSAGFEDVSAGSFAEDAIDCMAPLRDHARCLCH